MSLDHDTIMANAKDGSPFSNASQGYGWMENWCSRCKVDGPFQRDEADTGCPIVLVALIGKTPAEWTTVTEEDHVYGNYTCSEFVPDDEEDGDSEPAPPPYPQPVAELDGQVDIFSVFADGITEQVGEVSHAAV